MADKTPAEQTAAAKTPKSKTHHGVPILRTVVAAIVNDTGATQGAVIDELATLFTADVLKKLRDKLMPPKKPNALEKALGEKAGA